MSQILIAEDEPRIARFIEKGLRAKGYTTAIAQDGCQTVLLVQQEHFDLLLLDLNLPRKDGLTVVQELREQGQRLPIIIISAYNDLNQKTTGWQSRVNDYLTKPFQFEDLLLRVQTQLQQACD